MNSTLTSNNLIFQSHTKYLNSNKITKKNNAKTGENTHAMTNSSLNGIEMMRLIWSNVMHCLRSSPLRLSKLWKIPIFQWPSRHIRTHMYQSANSSIEYLPFCIQKDFYNVALFPYIALLQGIKKPKCILAVLPVIQIWIWSYTLHERGHCTWESSCSSPFMANAHPLTHLYTCPGIISRSTKNNTKEWMNVNRKNGKTIQLKMIYMSPLAFQYPFQCLISSFKFLNPVFFTRKGIKMKKAQNERK